MLFSLDWLLQLCPAKQDPERIVAGLTARGLTVDSVEGRGSDHVLDVDVPANRPDCLGHLGVAREISAAFGVPLADVPVAPATQGPPTEGEVRVEIDSPELCPRYTAGLVRDVRVGPSPDWVVRRLETCGLRSVSNVVDASNLVMLELGQPIHFFDLDRLQSGKDRPCIRVRTARDGETLRTLDGIDRRLTDDVLLITDDPRAVALAGVIGGAETEIGERTKRVLVEAAHFDPRSIRRTARTLALQTDASYRFERGLDPEAPVLAQALAARLLSELAGGSAAPGIVDAFPRPAEVRRLELRPGQLQRLLGFQPDGATIRATLGALGLAPEEAAEGRVLVTVPSWRRDLEREADLVEEVARHVGYEKIPTSLAIEGDDHAGPDRAALEDACRDGLAHLGFHEAIGYAMLAQGEDDRFVPAGAVAPLALDNPIAAQLALLRRSVLPGLLRAADLNLRRGNRDVRLFEVGSVFLPREEAGAEPDEPLRVGLVWSGSGEPRHWSRASREVDLYDVIGVAEHLLSAMRPGTVWKRTGESRSAFHPSHAVSWSAPEGATVAWGGALHPELQAGLDQRVFLLEVALDLVAAVVPRHPCQQPVPRVPAVTRDLSLMLPGDVTYGRVVETLDSIEAPAPARFEALDRYEGPPLAADETALTVRVTLVPLERTLTDDETEAYRRTLVGRLEQDLGVRLRG